MENLDKKGNNRFTARLSSEESRHQIDLNKMLLNIMRKKYPDNPFYKEGRLQSIRYDL